MARRPEHGRTFASAILCAALCLPAATLADPGPAALASERGCMSCHGLVRTQVGPGFAQIAQRYRSDTGAAVRLAARIRSGSIGHWGRLIMPAQARVTEPEAATLAAWVLAQPAPP